MIFVSFGKSCTVLSLFLQLEAFTQQVKVGRIN